MHRSEELRYLILAAQREGNRMLAQALKPLGVTPSQAEVLSLLRTRRPLSLNGLGDLLVCESGNSPSRLVDRLVAAGLVMRQTDDTDRRHVKLSLTPEGRASPTRSPQSKRSHVAIREDVGAHTWTRSPGGSGPWSATSPRDAPYPAAGNQITDPCGRPRNRAHASIYFSASR